MICGVQREAYKYICKYCCWQRLAFKCYWANRLLISFLLVYKATSSILSSSRQLSCFFFFISITLQSTTFVVFLHSAYLKLPQSLIEVRKHTRSSSLWPYFIGFTAWISNTGNRTTGQASKIRALWQTSTSSSVCSETVWQPSPWRMSPNSLRYLLLPAPRKGQSHKCLSIPSAVRWLIVRSVLCCKCVSPFTSCFSLFHLLYISCYLGLITNK